MKDINTIHKQLEPCNLVLLLLSGSNMLLSVPKDEANTTTKKY